MMNSIQLMSAAAPLREPGKVTWPRIRQASFDDYEEIAALGAANGLSTKSREQWLHIWLENPAYQELKGWPIGWVLEAEDEGIVGALENVPCLYRFGGRTFVGAFGRGWAVDRRYRAFGVLLVASQLRQANVD